MRIVVPCFYSESVTHVITSRHPILILPLRAPLLLENSFSSDARQPQFCEIDSAQTASFQRCRTSSPTSIHPHYSVKINHATFNHSTSQLQKLPSDKCLNMELPIVGTLSQLSGAFRGQHLVIGLSFSFSHHGSLWLCTLDRPHRLGKTYCNLYPGHWRNNKLTTKTARRIRASTLRCPSVRPWVCTCLYGVLPPCGFTVYRLEALPLSQWDTHVWYKSIECIAGSMQIYLLQIRPVNQV